MKKGNIRIGRVLLAGLLAICLQWVFVQPASAKAKKASTIGSTIENLLSAHNNELNAQARYLAFAKKADEEGYGKVACLFRAAAESEGIHAANEAKSIKAMKETPKVDIKTPQVNSTKENLNDAMRAESYESKGMYPEYFKKAEADKNKKAMIAFGSAAKVEANHAKLFEAARKDLKNWKDGTQKFLVCKVCGNTVEKVDFKVCPVCMEPARVFKKVD